MREPTSSYHGGAADRYHSPEAARSMPKSTPLADEVAKVAERLVASTRSKSWACSTDHEEAADCLDLQSEKFGVTPHWSVRGHT